MIQAFHSMVARNRVAGGGGPGEPGTPPTTNIWSGYVAGETCLNASDVAAAFGDAVKTWQEKAGAQGDGTQATSGNRPVYDDGGANWGNRGVLHFNGSTNSRHFTMPSAASLATPGGHAFLLARWALDPPTNSANTGLWHYGGSASSVVPWVDSNIYEIWGRSARPTVGNPAASLTVPRIYEVVSTAATFKVTLDGTVLYNSNYGVKSFATAPELGRTSASYSFSGEICAYLVYEGEQTGTDYTAIYDYLDALRP